MPHPLRHARALLTLALAGAASAALAQDARDRTLFDHWRQQHAPAVEAFQAQLVAAGVDGVVELHELLKSASAWQDCQADPYAVPPSAQWPAVVSVLSLVRELQRRGVLGAFQVHSGYREPVLNACAGGAARSAHTRAFALDLTPLGGEDPTPALCSFWREHGRAWAMGLSRYPSGRIHLDTLGYRTWGADHSGRSAVCAGAAGSGSPAQSSEPQGPP